jgi:hypothetical protein
MNIRNSKSELSRKRPSHVQLEQTNKRRFSGITKAASRRGSQKTAMTAIGALNIEPVQNDRD